MVSQNTRVIAMLGATGGCTVGALVNSLKAGLTCRALVRREEKLHRMLADAGVSEETISRHLTVVKGDALVESDVAAVLKTSTGFVDRIVFGLGATFEFTPSLCPPKLVTIGSDLASICTQSMHTVLKVIASAPSPIPICCISTTGVSTVRDVPLALYGLYHAVLATPHKDKREMERIVVKALDDGMFGSVMIVRPTLLNDGAEDAGKLRVGTEQKPEMGYSVSRKAVGRFIFESFVARDDLPRLTKASLTF